MTSLHKFFYIVLIGILFISFTSGCQKVDMSIPDNNITCYAATYSKGIYKSDNGGESWYPLAIDQEDLYLYFKRFFISPGSRLLYVGTTGAGLYAIDLKEMSLNRVESLKNENIRTVIFIKSADIQNSFQVLAGTLEHGIYSPKNNGNEWEFLNKGLTYRDVNTLLVCQQKGIFAGTIKDVFKFNRSSNLWTSVSKGIKNKNIISMACNRKANILYAGAGGYDGKKDFFDNIPCLYKSTDKGKSWVESDRGIPEDSLIYDIAVNPKKPERMYIGTSNGIYLSTNKGEKWSKLEDGLPEELRVFDIKIIPVAKDKDIVYAATSKGVFTALDNDDVPWTSRSYGLPQTNITSIVLIPGNGEELIGNNL